MPLHEFWCPKCNTNEERLIFNVKEEKALRCSKCKGKVMRKISAANFEVRGYNAANRYSKEKKDAPV